MKVNEQAVWPAAKFSEISGRTFTLPRLTTSHRCSMLHEIADKSQIWLPIGTFLLGFFVRTFTLSKADRVSNERAKFELTKELANSQNDAFQKLMQALTEYSAKTTPPSLEDFFSISTPSQNYLYQQKMTADAILSGRVDSQSARSTFMPKLVETADTLVPKIYATLKDIADRNGLPYPDHFDRANYQSIFDAVEAFHGREAVKRLSNEE